MKRRASSWIRWVARPRRAERPRTWRVFEHGLDSTELDQYVNSSPSWNMGVCVYGNRETSQFDPLNSVRLRTPSDAKEEGRYVRRAPLHATTFGRANVRPSPICKKGRLHEVAPRPSFPGQVDIAKQAKLPMVSCRMDLMDRTESERDLGTWSLYCSASNADG